MINFRDKLYSSYENFVQEAEKSNLSKTCDEIEDWLYGDGEDLPKSKKSPLKTEAHTILDAYVERKTNLDAVIAPIKHRLTEFEGRKSAFESLTNVLNVYQKVFSSLGRLLKL